MKHYIYIIVILFLISCSSTSKKLVDEYYLYSPDDYSDTYYLRCKLSSETDPWIDSIHSVFWNDSIIIIERMGEKHTWWIIKASGKFLKCCNQDKILGPFSTDYMQKEIFIKNIRYNKITTE